MSNEEKFKLIEKLKLASSNQISKGSSFVYSSLEFTIKWKDLIELVDTIHIDDVEDVEDVEDPIE